MCPSLGPSLNTLSDCGGEESTQMCVHTSSGMSGLWRGCPVGRAPWVSRLSQPDMNLESDPMALNRGRMPSAAWLRIPLRIFEVSTIRIIIKKRVVIRNRDNWVTEMKNSPFSEPPSPHSTGWRTDFQVLGFRVSFRVLDMWFKHLQTYILRQVTMSHRKRNPQIRETIP